MEKQMNDHKINALVAEHLMGWKWENRPAGMCLVAPKKDGENERIYHPDHDLSYSHLPEATDEQIAQLKALNINVD